MSQEHDDHRPSGTGKPPGYVITLWVSAQLRDRIQRLGPALADVLQAADRGDASEASQDPDREAGQSAAG